MSADQPAPAASMTLSPEEQAQLDRVVAGLAAKKAEWAQLPLAEYMQIIDEMLAGLPDSEAAWVETGLEITGGQAGGLVEAEFWFYLAIIYRLLRFLRASLARLERGQPPFPPEKLRHRKDHVEAPIMPASPYDRLALPGIRADVWLDPGNLSQAASYREANRQGSLCLIFGAGNVPAVVPIDLLHKLFVEGQVVVVKTNPANQSFIPVFKAIFQPLIRRGYLQVVPGDKAEGAYLAHHAQVDELHITGSERTYQAILFGGGEEGQRRKQARQPLLTKRFTAELGNISPVIIVPGPWSARDMRYQSRKIASWLSPNAGHNCVTPHVLIQMHEWDQRLALNQSIADFLEGSQTRKAYYPGSEELHRAFLNAHPEALQLGRRQDGHLPWTFIPDLDPDDREEICFRREAFFGLFSETSLAAGSVAEYIHKAVEFANENLWGTLTASIVVHPRSLKDPAVKAALEAAIGELHYGTVTVNHWGALPYYLIVPWGGAPGQDIYNAQSGVDWVNNPCMFDAPIKSVVRAPFRQIPDPFMVDAKNSYPYFVRDARFQAHPSFSNLVRLLWAAVRS